jgi:hypothetical protein
MIQEDKVEEANPTMEACCSLAGALPVSPGTAGTAIEEHRESTVR